jgi:hypothetical protein
MNQMYEPCVLYESNLTAFCLHTVCNLNANLLRHLQSQFVQLLLYFAMCLLNFIPMAVYGRQIIYGNILISNFLITHILASKKQADGIKHCVGLAKESPIICFRNVFPSFNLSYVSV